MENIRVTYQQTEPEPIWMDLDGVHFPLTGALAFFYRWFQVMDCEEAANRELRPWIMGARSAWMKKREAVTAPQQITAQSLKKGI